MNINFKNILILGQSEKFIDIVASQFRTANIRIIPWRGCNNYIDLNKVFMADLIVVCGYDYSSSLYNFDRYIDVNVKLPYKVISALSTQSTIIIYIDTDHGSSRFTFSRYQFAKNILAVKILKRFNNAHILRIPTVLNNDGKADIQGGQFTKLIFNTFIRFGLLKAISLVELSKLFLVVLERENHLCINVLRPFFLKFRRTLFIDRVLRFIGG